MGEAAGPSPAGFVRIGSGPVTLVADEAFAGTLDALGLTTPGALARTLATAGGPAGRGRVAVLALPGSGARLCLRPLHRGGWIGRWLPRTLATLGRPLSELSVNARLHAAGAPVPRPLLVIGERGADGRFLAAVGTILEEDSVDALQFLETQPAPAALWSAAAAAGRAVRRFHDAGGRHADLHVKNVLLRARGDAYDALVIDLDHARMDAAVAPRARLAELMRLHRSLVKRRMLGVVGPRGCARFFGAYVAGDRTLRRALRAGLPRERLRLAMHALHYRGAAPRAR